MSTLEDVIQEAKMTGEYESSAEDIKATSIEISNEQILTVDPSSGSETKLITLLLDRGISFQAACGMALESAPDKESDKKSPAENTADNSAKEEEKQTQVSEVSTEEEVPSAEEEQEMLRTTLRRVQHVVADPGFYVSRNRIAGRNLVLFAKRKFDPSSFKTEEEAAEFDPLGLMAITRPNTGSNREMSTRDLKTKYRLALSSQELSELEIMSEQSMASTNDNANVNTLKVVDKDLVDKKDQETTDNVTMNVETKENLESKESPCNNALPLSPLEVIVRKEKPQVVQLWNAAFEESNHLTHENGLAPRRAELGIVIGAVLHILPTLEKAVVMRSVNERKLKIIRAEVPSISRRLVGIKFPTDNEAIQKLLAELEQLKKDQANAGSAFHDESIQPICPKSLEWATAERKTMKSFFKVMSKSAPDTNNDKDSSSASSSALPLGKRKISTSDSFPSALSNANGTTPWSQSALPKKASASNKKQKQISSFFAKKGF